MRLHITNGDSAGAMLTEIFPGDRVLPWRDVLHDGPIPLGQNSRELAETRARFLSESFKQPNVYAPSPGSFDDILADFEKRAEVMENAGQASEVILWFEHDLYDQLQLLQVLDQLRGRTDINRLSMVSVDRFDGVR